MKHHKSRTCLIVFFSVAFLYFGSLSRVDALPIIEIDGVLVATDQGAGDINPASGIVLSTNFHTTGSTTPAIGTAALPEMFLRDNLMFFAAGTTQIVFNETDFSATNILGFSNSVAGTLTSFGPLVTAQFDFYLGIDNDNKWQNDGPAMSSLLAVPSPAGDFSTSHFFDIGLLSSPLTSPYALTIVATITTQGAGFAMPGFGAGILAVPAVAAAVPEPATVTLLGIGLAGLFGGYLVRRKTRRGNGESNNNR